MVDFLTVEDINSVLAEYYNTPFWDSVVIDTLDTNNFSNLYFDYLKVSRTHSSNYTFTIKVENDLRTGSYYFLDGNDEWLANVTESSGTITVVSTTPVIKVFCQLFIQSTSQTAFNNVEWIVEDVSPKLASKADSINVTVSLKEVNPNFTVDGKTFNVNGASVVCSDKTLEFTLPYNNGYNCIIGYNGVSTPVFIYSNIKNMNIIDVPAGLVCISGRTNTFTLISESSSLTVDCQYPVTVNGKEITIDLTTKTDVKSFEITVHTKEDTDYYPNDFTFRLTCDYATISTIPELTNLLNTGGIGKLGNDITITNDLTLNKNVYLIGNNYTLNFDSHKLIVLAEKTFKASDMIFTNGLNTIQQNVQSKVELINCTFNDCLGLGSVIDCQVDVASLENESDFTTILTNCTFNNNEMCILHGGELTVESCTVNGKIGDTKYPYFLYQTDGNAVILNSSFDLSSEYEISHDIEFNSCIFVCGENAQINSLDYDELQSNDITQFISAPQNNKSRVGLTYYYDLISDYVTLQTDKGFCHTVSNFDFIFKTNVSLQRRV